MQTFLCQSLKRIGSAASIASLLLSISPIGALAETVFVRDATGVAVSASELQVASELVRSSVPQIAGFQLALDAKKAEITLQPKVIRLDETLMLTIQKVKGDQVERSDQIKVADFDELDMVALRLTRAVLEGKPVADSERVDEVTRNEQQVMGRRKQVAENWVLGFGPHAARSMETSGTVLNFHIGYSWLVKPQSEIQLSWDSSASSGTPAASLSYLALGYTHLFSSGDRAPFVSGEMGYGSADFKSPTSAVSGSARGFVGGAGVGYRLFRTSRINLDLQLRGALLFSSGNEANPGVYGFRLSLYF